MGQVSVRVNGFNHTIGCKDGEEQHVLQLVAQIEDKVGMIRGMGGQFSESRMLLHVALLLADEAGDLKAAAVGNHDAKPASQPPATADRRLADRLAGIAERIEGLAQTIDRG